MLSGLWAALMGLLMIMWENPFPTVAAIVLISLTIMGYRMWRTKPAARESRVVKVAFGDHDLDDLSRQDLDCDYYIKAGRPDSPVSPPGLVFEKVGREVSTAAGFIMDRHGDRWLQTEGDMVVTRNDKVIAVMAVSGFPSLDVMHDMMEDLEAHTTWRYLTDSTRRVVNSLSTLVAYALLLVNDVSTPSNERAETSRSERRVELEGVVQEVPGHPEEEFLGDVHPRRPDGSPSSRDMGGRPPHQGSSGSQPVPPGARPRGRLITLD